MSARPAQTPSDQSIRPWSRQADRRRAFYEFLGFLAAGVTAARSPVVLRERFEQGLRRLLAAREVHLGGASAVEGRRPGEDRLAVNVPCGGPHPVRLEAVADEAASFDDWDRQILRAARHLAVLVWRLDEYRERDAAGCASLVPLGRAGPALLLGSSPAIQRVRDRIARVAATDFTVLIEGESGTGKELVARQIHELSRRRHGPFVAINCAALVESLLEAELFGIEDRTATGVRGRRGKIEHADRGTLFLDEVGDLSRAAQAKLLRAIQEMAVERVGGYGARRVDVRLIVATNRSLLDLVERGQFRLDLFYRLNGVEVTLPPLRDRREDILELAEAFLARYRAARVLSLSGAVKDALMAYHWPGNVRELERVIERAVALASSSVITLEDLPPALVGEYNEAIVPALQRDESLRTWAGRYARLVLERCGNNKRKACRVLGISYHTLQGYLEQGSPEPLSASPRATRARGRVQRPLGRAHAGRPHPDGEVPAPPAGETATEP